MAPYSLNNKLEDLNRYVKRPLSTLTSSPTAIENNNLLVIEHSKNFRFSSGC